MNETHCGAAVAWMATRETKRWCVALVGDKWEMIFVKRVGAGIMGFEGCRGV